MARERRGKLTAVNNSIDDILRTVNMTTASAFTTDKNIKSIAAEAPINPFNTDAKEFFANYTGGDYEMGWFRNYDHYATNSGSNFTVEPATGTYSQIGGTNVVMNALGFNTRPILISHFPEINSTGDVALTTGSLFSFAYRVSGNSPNNQTAKITVFGVGGAGGVYSGNIDTETIATTVQSFGVAPVERTFITSSMGVMAYRNSGDGADTWGRVFKVSTAGAVTFENAFEISVAYNQLFNKSINVGNGRALFSSMRGGNDFQLHYFKYNGVNSYTAGSVQVTSTQHAGYPTMAYATDDRVLYIYTRRPSSSGEDRYVNGKLYDTSTFPPTLLTTATEYDYGTQRLGRMGDAAVGVKASDARVAYGVFVTSDTNDNKGLAIPFSVGFDVSSAVVWLPGSTTTLKCVDASRMSTGDDAFKSPHHVTPLGISPSNSDLFLYHCIITPNYGWILAQNTTTGALTTISEGETNNYDANNTFLRADTHYFGVSGNGHKGLPAGNYEANRQCIIVAGEFGSATGDKYLGAAGMIF